MKDQSLTTFETWVFLLTALGLAGVTIVATFTVSLQQQVNRLRSNAKTTEKTHSPAGLKNSSVRLVTQEEWLGWSSTRNTERQMQEINSALSHCQCSCNCSKKPDTNE